MGLSRAGFEVVGFDIEAQKNYPFEFHQADALEVDLSDFDAVWASPPCQFYTVMRSLPWLRDREYWDSIPPTRDYLESSAKPYVIENVMGAVWRGALKGGFLCGQMFGLRVYRHRGFETNWYWMSPGHPRHEKVIRPGRMIGSRAREAAFKTGGISVYSGGHRAKVEVATMSDGMGIDWMSGNELSQAIPPAYSEYLGRQMMATMRKDETV